MSRTASSPPPRQYRPYRDPRAASRTYPATAGRVWRAQPATSRTSHPLLVAALVSFAGGLAVLLLLLAIVLGVYGYYQVTRRIVPGIQTAGMSLGGMTVPEAAAALHQAWNVERKIAAADGLHTWEVAPTQLGLSLDPGTTAADAYSVAHEQDILRELGQMTVSLNEGWEIQPVIRFDEAAARAGLEALAAQGSQPPRDATFYIENGQVVPVPGELGYTINIDETIQRIAADPLGVFHGGLLPVALMPVPPRLSDVSAAAAEAQRLLDTPLTLKAYDPVSDEYLDLPVPRETVGSWLQVEPGEDGPQVTVDESRVADSLAELSGSLGPERFIDGAKYGPSVAEAVRQSSTATLIVSHQPTRYVVQPGDTLLKIGWRVGMPFWKVLEANPGLDPENLWAGQEITIPSKDELLPLPVIPNKRIVISIGKQRLWAYQDGELLNKFVISTGIDRSPTQPGVFQVQTHDPKAYASVWDLYMPDFLGIYEAWPGFMNGIHGLPTLSNGRRLWANILGQPASYGCIILDLDASAWLYDWAEEGVVVVIEE